MSEKCRICPRMCNTERIFKKGFCSMPLEPVLARCSLHYWEEPCISGAKGSGTVFFSGCSLKCVFCQNYKLSHNNYGETVTKERLGEIFLELEEQGAENINLVNPTHFIPVIAQTLRDYSVKIPVVYNSSGYERVESLRCLEGLIDIYLPDLKYYDSEVSAKYAAAPDYFEYASSAVLEMARQVGAPVFDEQGRMTRGLMVRHLILPANTNQSIKILQWVKENLPERVYVSLMCQYTPYGNLEAYPELNRRITKREYEKVVRYMEQLGLLDGYVQERSSANQEYIPDFSLQGVLQSWKEQI